MKKSNKISSYQKLKNENQKLLEDIRVLIMSENWLEQVKVESKYRIMFDMEDMKLMGKFGEHEGCGV